MDWNQTTDVSLMNCLEDARAERLWGWYWYGCAKFSMMIYIYIYIEPMTKIWDDWCRSTRLSFWMKWYKITGSEHSFRRIPLSDVWYRV